MADTRRPRGRPRGEPSLVVNVRLPLSLLERLDRYLDRTEQRSHIAVNRGLVMREALEEYLEREE
jgi:hypothetical protein